MNVAAALLLDMTLKASLLCGLGFAAAAAARRASGAARHDLWLAVLVCSGLLPLGALLLRYLGPELSLAPVHSAAIALAPALPRSAPTGAVELVDRIWSGDGGAWSSGWGASLLVALWAAGVAVALVRLLVDHRAARATVRRGVPFGRLPAPSGVRLITSTEVPGPAVFGLRSAVVLLPDGADKWPRERLEAVIAHELAHAARRDCAWDLLVRLACALHWYNPLVHRAARALRAERELACDERVVSAGVDPFGYAAALVEVARSSASPPSGALLAMAQRSQLERRITSLLERRHHSTKARVRRGLSIGFVGLFLPLGLVTAPAAGVLPAGSVQPERSSLSGLDDPMSELVPLPYEEMAGRAAAVPADGPVAGPVRALQMQLSRESRGHGDLVRQRAIWTLNQVRGGRLLEPLAERVSDPDWRLRAYAAWGLAATGDRRAVPLLASMLDDPVWRVRAMAAAGHAELGDPSAAEAVIAAADDPAWQVRISALSYVDRVGDGALAARLRPLLDDPHYGTRTRAREVLARF